MQFGSLYYAQTNAFGMVIFEARTVVFVEESKPAFGSLLSTRKSRDLQGIKQYRGINEKQENLTHF